LAGEGGGVGVLVILADEDDGELKDPGPVQSFVTQPSLLLPSP
jgi:hypothetical protein